MRIKSLLKRILGLNKKKNVPAPPPPPPPPPPVVKHHILLLTNRDSDNVGDQVIEACDISLIKTIMENLGVEKGTYKINSRAAGFITQKYLATSDETLLKDADNTVKQSDILIFGGAPLFNYAYQNFYQKTIVTLDLAEKYNVPAIFSSIGIEGYDEDNPKCQALKKSLNNECVKQITTRDDMDSLQKYIYNKNIFIDKVSDPAVFTSEVFKKFSAKPRDKTIGLFVARSMIFMDNKIDFSHDDQFNFWLSVVKSLEEKGYSYEFLTTGHFADEMFLDALSRESNLPLKKFVFNMNNPEKLTKKISSYAGVISYRLHASIISFSFGVPSVGLVWNQKVSLFYEAIGYPERAFDVEDWSADTIVPALEKAIEQGVDKNTEYCISVYNTLFNSLKSIIDPESDIKAYDYNELQEKCSVFEGTSNKEKEAKLKRKMRRTYQSYNEFLLER